MSAATVDGEGHAALPAGGFRSVLCGVDRGVDSRAAHEQAVWLASAGGTVEVVRAPELTRRGRRALLDACEGHDLLAVGAGAGVLAVVEHAPIPVLIGRWSALDREVTDTVLVAVDDSPASSRAVEFAGLLAADHDGTVMVLVAPARDAALERAIAASRRVLFRITGATAPLLGERLAREDAIPSAALAADASLVVLGTGDSRNSRRMTAQIAGRVQSSVLSIPRWDSCHDADASRASYGSLNVDGTISGLETATRQAGGNGRDNR
jgi:nucleotide-binding universal stress UspA family protein